MTDADEILIEALLDDVLDESIVRDAVDEATARRIDQTTNGHQQTANFTHALGRERLTDLVIAGLHSAGLGALAAPSRYDGQTRDRWHAELVKLISLHMPEGA